MAGKSFETGERGTFSIPDYVLFGLMLFVSASIGVFYAIKDRRRKNTKEFLLAGGNMNPIPVALSLLASFMSAITLLGVPAEMYNYSTIYFWIGVGYTLVVAGAAHIYIPVFYRLRVTSAYEYLEKRFSRGVRTAGSMTFCVQMLLYMAIVLYAPSLALNAVTGLTLWGSVISVGCVCIFYTALGGMKAVLWTDTFQACMMFAGLFAIVIKGMMEVGGLSEAWRIMDESGRVIFDDFRVNPSVRHTVWSLVIGGYFTWVAIYGTNQAQVQRACSCPTLRKAQIAMWLNVPGLCLILCLGCFIGVALYAFYSTCDPIKFKLIDANDQLLPLFVMDVLGEVQGVPGLFVASIFSGALSTISSGLNSMAAVILQDVIRNYIVKDMTEARATLVAKIIAVVLGVVCLGLTWVASLLGDVLQAALSLFGMIGGPLLGLFTMGMMCPWANTYGAYAGLFTALAFTFWIGIGAQVVKPPVPKGIISTAGCNWNLTTTAASVTAAMGALNATTTMDPTTMMQNITETVTMSKVEQYGPVYYLYTLSYIWYSLTAVITVLIVGLTVSFITGPTKPKDIDPMLMCPIIDVLFPYLPDKIRKPFRFGINYDKLKEFEKRDTMHTAEELSEKDVEKYFDTSLEVKVNDKAVSNGSIPDSYQTKDNIQNGGVDNPSFHPKAFYSTNL